jgi:hypothetical protein
VFLLGYVLVLGWFANRSPDASGDYLFTQPWRVLQDWCADMRWELALIPVLLTILWRLRVLWGQLNRTVMASILSVSEDLGLTVVGAPDLLRRREPEPGPSEPVAQKVDQPAAALRVERVCPIGTGTPPSAPQPVAPPEPFPATGPAPVPHAPVVPGPHVPV